MASLMEEARECHIHFSLCISEPKPHSAKTASWTSREAILLHQGPRNWPGVSASWGQSGKMDGAGWKQVEERESGVAANRVKEDVWLAGPGPWGWCIISQPLSFVTKVLPNSWGRKNVFRTISQSTSGPLLDQIACIQCWISWRIFKYERCDQPTQSVLRKLNLVILIRDCKSNRWVNVSSKLPCWDLMSCLHPGMAIQNSEVFWGWALCLHRWSSQMIFLHRKHWNKFTLDLPPILTARVTVLAHGRINRSRLSCTPVKLKPQDQRKVSTYLMSRVQPIAVFTMLARLRWHWWPLN
jgi:hypothetical protein